MTAPEPALPPERVEELAEAEFTHGGYKHGGDRWLCWCGADLRDWWPAGGVTPRDTALDNALRAHRVEALAPLVAGWLAEAERHLPDGDAWVERRRAEGAAEVRARVDAAVRLVSPDHITPMGARQIRAVLATEREEWR